MYVFHFSTSALVVENVVAFIPPNWENGNKSVILHGNSTTVKPEDTWEDHCKTHVRKLVHDEELTAKDEQVFLVRQPSPLAKPLVMRTRAYDSPMKWLWLPKNQGLGKASPHV